MKTKNNFNNEKNILNDKAFILIKKAIENESNSNIFFVTDMLGTHIQCGDEQILYSKNLTTDEWKEWKDSFELLKTEGLIKPIAPEGAVYEVTVLGFDYYNSTLDNNKQKAL